LRYNEDWSFLHDPSRRTDWLDPVKFIPLDGTNVYVSFGGEARLKYERYDEPVLNQKPADKDGFLLQRYLLHADVQLGSHFRAFDAVRVLTRFDEWRADVWLGQPVEIDTGVFDDGLTKPLSGAVTLPARCLSFPASTPTFITSVCRGRTRGSRAARRMKSATR